MKYFLPMGWDNSDVPINMPEIQILEQDNNSLPQFTIVKYKEIETGKIGYCYKHSLIEK